MELRYFQTCCDFIIQRVLSSVALLRQPQP